MTLQAPLSLEAAYLTIGAEVRDEWFWLQGSIYIPCSFNAQHMQLSCHNTRASQLGLLGDSHNQTFQD